MKIKPIYLFVIFAVIFLVDLVIIDPLPYIDEIISGGIASYYLFKTLK